MFAKEKVVGLSHPPSHPPKDGELVGSFNPFEKYLKPPTRWCFMLIAPISAPLTRKVLKKKRFVIHASAATWYLNASRYHKKRTHQPKPRWTHHQFLNWKSSRLSTAGPHHIGSESSPKTFKAIFIPNLSIDDMPRCLPSITPHTFFPPLGNLTFFATCPVGGNGWSTKLPMKQIVPSCANFGKYTLQYSTIWIRYKRNTHKISMGFFAQLRVESEFSRIKGKGLLMWPGFKNRSP